MTPEDRAALLKAIKRAGLTPVKLTVVFMYAWGFTQKDIGEVLGLHERTVCDHWLDSIERLRALLYGDSAILEAIAP